MNPLVSIIIPNYNNEKYLVECLDSCLKQTYKNIEIIVVDDCSTDNSIDVISEIQKTDTRIKLIKNKNNMKVSRSRDIGIMNSKADWITTLDSDDFYISTDKIQKEVDIIKKYNFNINIIAYSGIVAISSIRRKLMLKRNIKEGDLYLDILTRNCAIPRDFLFSKELYFCVGKFDFNILIYEDWDLKIRLAEKAKFYYTGIDAIGYRQHRFGLSSAKKSLLLKWINYIFDKNSKNLENKNKVNEKLMQNFNISNFKKILKFIEGFVFK